MTIDEKVTVGMVNNIPKYVIWKNNNYKVTKIGLHHTYFEGEALIHVFSVITDTLFMKLELNTNNLLWNLIETEPV